MPQCRTCHHWNGPIIEHIDHSHCLHYVKNYMALRKEGTNKSCGHYEKKYYYKVVTSENHSCATRSMEHHEIYEDGKIISAKSGTPGIMFFSSFLYAQNFLEMRPGCKIKKIRPLSKITRWSKIACKKRPPPIGSLCSRKVKVLGDL